MSVKTVNRIKDGHRQSRATIAAIARALGTTPEVLCAPPSDAVARQTDATFKAAGYRRISTYISGTRALQYALVEARYGVSPRSLVDLAPLLMTLLAEMSLAERKSQLEAYRSAHDALSNIAPSHLHGVVRAGVELDFASEAEEASIAAADIRGTTIDDAELPEDSDLFVEFLSRTSSRLDSAAIDYVSGTIDWLEYGVLQPDLDRITNGDRRAEFALERGHAGIRDIPAQLVGADHAADRAAWLRNRVPDAAWNEREAELAELDELIGSMTPTEQEGQQ